MTRQAQIDEIEAFPARLRTLVDGLSPEQLTTPALAGEWTVAQNVHHLADSHLNSYVRCKLMMTEDHPTLRPYDEAAWGQLPDAVGADLSATLLLLEGLHQRWTQFWRTLPEAAWARSGYHPASGEVTLAEQLTLYVAHGRAHLDQISRTLAAQS